MRHIWAFDSFESLGYLSKKDLMALRDKDFKSVVEGCRKRHMTGCLPPQLHGIPASTIKNLTGLLAVNELLFYESAYSRFLRLLTIHLCTGSISADAVFEQYEHISEFPSYICDSMHDMFAHHLTSKELNLLWRYYRPETNVLPKIYDNDKMPIADIIAKLHENGSFMVPVRFLYDYYFYDLKHH